MGGLVPYTPHWGLHSQAPNAFGLNSTNQQIGYHWLAFLNQVCKKSLKFQTNSLRILSTKSTMSHKKMHKSETWFCVRFSTLRIFHANVAISEWIRVCISLTRKNPIFFLYPAHYFVYINIFSRNVNINSIFIRPVSISFSFHQFPHFSFDKLSKLSCPKNTIYCKFYLKN